MAKLIDVEERDLEYIFGKTKPYKLDVYQRDYRWSDDKDYKIVSQLLQDIALRFEHNEKQHKAYHGSDLSKIVDDVSTNFKPYFLNTIMLNEQDGHIYIVDGQQRLTTLLLLFIKLYHLGKANDCNGANIEKLLGEKIYEEDKAAVKHFKISNPDRNLIVKKIFEQDDIVDEDINNITQKNLAANYEVISKNLDKYFSDTGGTFLSEKLNYYIYYLLEKVLIIEQIIKHKEDVAMIFETANDRGKALESHEVLKGMLLGVLDVEEKEKCNTIWNEALTTFFRLDDNYKNVDEFFRMYFRAKYADNTTQYNTFSSKYHRNLLANDRIVEALDRSDPSKISSFIKNEFKYFYKVFLEILEATKSERNIYLASNSANDRGQQALLMLSALIYNDPKKNDKIDLIAKKVDQFYSIARLIGVYDSNDHNRVYIDINKAIRNKPLSIIEEEFNKAMIIHFNEKSIPIKSLEEVFQYKYFKDAKIDGQFTKYVLARVDHFLAELLNEQSFAKQEKLHFITHSGKKPKNGFHTEHMFSFNDKIRGQFLDESGEHDEKLFLDERNRLGALLLLKGNENIRTSNWIYRRKKKSYANSGFIWNRILTNSINKASLNSSNDEILDLFKSYEPDDKGLLPRSVIEDRQYLLFVLFAKIYKF